MDATGIAHYVDWIEGQLLEARRVQEAIRELTPTLVEIALRMVRVFREGGRVYLFGNGGSAADAQHWAAELSGRFYLNRPALPAIALTTNTSQLTAIGNDFGYEWVFARPLAGLLERRDMVIGISTSGSSPNVIRAFEVARSVGAVTVGFTGATGGELRALCDYLVAIPSMDVARIQEGHELCGHLICAIVERELFGKEVP
ncbi:MAG: D-sedoheptulose 7-phosphate isomerase [Bacteroidetes bacterium]|nr:D-sedoheptulose 7-phosphate isomerase [Bacteroidota bacterium]MDW8136892.1 D-sedoheptulose 7-phosphate isomerase [Bacteroidota bacterium]